MSVRQRRIRAGYVTALLAVLGATGSAASAWAQRGGPPQPVVDASGTPPTGIVITASASYVTIQWQPTAGATGYTVERWLQSDPICCRHTSPPLPNPSWLDQGPNAIGFPEEVGPYVFRVSAIYPNARIGSIERVWSRTISPGQLGLQVTGGPGKAIATWNPNSNAKFSISRRALTDGSTHAATGITNGRWVDVAPNGQGLFTPGTYEYQLRALISDGSISEQTVLWYRPDPENPKNFFAKDIGGGQVELSWQGDTLYQSYWLHGPGVSGERIYAGALGQDQTYIVSGLVPGRYEWTLIGYYYPGNVGGEANPARTSGIVSEWSGRFNVVVTGFTVNNQTDDDPWQSDGKGDEVFVSVAVASKSASGTTTTLFESPDFGDTNGQPGRVLAGSASSLGGLLTGNTVSFNGSQVMLLFTGTIAEKESAVLVVPTIWEVDNNRSFYGSWVTLASPPTGKLHSAVIETGKPALDFGFTPRSLEDLLPNSSLQIAPAMMSGVDRPVRLSPWGSGAYFYPLALTFNWLAVKHMKAGSSQSIPVRLTDGVGKGDYTLHLRIDRTS